MKNQTGAKKRFKSEDIIYRLWAAEVMTGQVKTVAEVSRQLGVTEQTKYWSKEYSGLKVEKSKRQKELEQDNARLHPVLPKSLHTRETPF